MENLNSKIKDTIQNLIYSPSNKTIYKTFGLVTEVVFDNTQSLIWDQTNEFRDMRFRIPNEGD